MKKYLLLLSLVLAGFLIVSCDESALGISVDPEIRLYAAPGVTVYFCLGTYDAATGDFDNKTDWLYADEGDYSSYKSLPAGTYYAIYDDDFFHMDATVDDSQTWTVSSNMTYRASFSAPGSYTFAAE